MIEQHKWRTLDAVVRIEAMHAQRLGRRIEQHGRVDRRHTTTVERRHHGDAAAVAAIDRFGGRRCDFVRRRVRQLERQIVDAPVARAAVANRLRHDDARGARRRHDWDAHVAHCIHRQLRRFDFVAAQKQAC